MAGSQLKRLKASLREQGITGPQKSKKQRRKLAQEDPSRNDKRLQRGVVLEGIREQFNPFDLKHAARGPKFEVTTNRPKPGNASIKGRPGLAKAAAEEKRKQTLLVDMQRRNKVGGILDRRFGENDPTMTPEEKMLERFAREKQKAHKKNSLFDLEDDEPMGGLTHAGRSLTFDDQEELVDDFNEDDLEEGDEDSDGSSREKRLKRLRAIIAAGEEEAEDGEPERKKTKKEVMEEVIAKSKLHRYERQAAKDDDADLRMQLDKELPNIQQLLWSGLNGAKRQDNAAPLPTIAGVERDAFERNFDIEVKRLAQDKRAQPSNRTKTDEEKAEEESARLKKLEEKRQKRMMGEEVSDSEEDEEDKKQDKKSGGMEADEDDDDDDFGLGHGIKARPTATELGFDDEDDFVIEDDLVASGSDLELVESDDDLDDEEEDDEGSAGEAEAEDDDDEFTKGLLNEAETKNPIFQANFASNDKSDENGLPFTFPCPQTCAEFVAITKDYEAVNLPRIVQRIRALHHPKLDSKNKEKLANFSVALVDFVALPWDAKTSPPFSVLESLIRHIHSLAKMFPIEIAKQFLQHLEEISEDRPIALQPSDLTVLTAIGTIFPTSDHFHQVVTPTMLTIGRYIGQKVPRELSDYSIGTYLSILSLQYQQLAKRYVPEVINFALNTVCSLAPTAPSRPLGNFPVHEPPVGSRIQKSKSVELRRLNFADCLPETSQEDSKSLKISLLTTTIQVLDAAADLWAGKPAFLETFGQVIEVLHHVNSKSQREHLPAAVSEKSDRLEEKLKRMSRVSQISRRPLELHHHKPLAIKTYIPKFEETFDPDKHYDPDRERAEMAKLKKEHKKERKGAMRELRKDANFMARENLRIKKAKDEAYEKKYKRLVAEIQNEEGREANAYEREAKARKRANTRK
ncbi:Nop14-like protein [Trichoderma longibrachiatum ATCC 18648]|uniref:Nop14-like protein n=1 Tax=Trichoderma longibrachiatum ATCC 18648 TaxID=983965 RepID=A0A2T4CJ87_TRILO|nr:Nop14-like protein [Trichoderma longibrachiatum ATCC 18648]